MTGLGRLGQLGWWRQQLSDLAVDRSRIVLVMLGVVWGTLSLTVVLAFAAAFTDAMGSAIHSTGDDLIRLSSGATTRPFEGLPAGRRIRLTPDDAAALREAVPALAATSAEFSTMGSPLMYRRSRYNVRVHAVEPAYGELRFFAPEPGGRFINAPDLEGKRAVAFLGNRIAAEIFGDEPAVGGRITLWGRPFTVIGVMRPKVPLGNYNGLDEDKVLIPATTFAAMHGWRFVSFIIAGVGDVAREGEALKGIYRVLGRRHGFDPADLPALDVRNYIVDMGNASYMVQGIRWLMIIVATLGMLVALVGVANVMYVMVEERRREFGVQMALGARPGWIARQRLLEGAVVTTGGAALGVLLAAVVLYAMGLVPMDEQARGYLGTPALSLATALGVSASLGVAGAVAGYLPARRAASTAPVEVLREE